MEFCKFWDCNYENIKFLVTMATIMIWAYGVMVACLIFIAATGVQIPVVVVKCHNVYDYTIERHPWQVSENYKLRVDPSHVREIVKW